ncbi:unnamed protein product [Cochlearia groenlandica]
MSFVQVLRTYETSNNANDEEDSSGLGMKSGAKWIRDDDGDGGDSKTEPARCGGGSEARWEWTSQAIDGRIARCS